MRLSRNSIATSILLTTLILSAAGFAAASTAENPAGDQAILQQAANAMVFQTVLADVILATSTDDGIVALARYIHDLSERGLASIETMATECQLSIDAHLDPTAWRRLRALREVVTPHLRDQVYLDTQLIRLYEARQENLEASVRARHTVVKGFTIRSEPEIEDLILKVRDVVQRGPTPAHK